MKPNPGTGAGVGNCCPPTMDEGIKPNSAGGNHRWNQGIYRRHRRWRSHKLSTRDPVQHKSYPRGWLLRATVDHGCEGLTSLITPIIPVGILVNN